MGRSPASLRTQLFADPEGKFVHDVVLDSCRRHAAKIAIVDVSCVPVQRITYAAYGAMVESAARGLVASGIRPGEVIGIFLPNCWEFGVAYHAATLAGAIPTTLNPTYREREVRYQLENSEAVALITDGALLTGIDLAACYPRCGGCTPCALPDRPARSLSTRYSKRRRACICRHPSATRDLRWRRFLTPAAPRAFPRA
jgi:fatty-acyl-CoA synthase